MLGNKITELATQSVKFDPYEMAQIICNLLDKRMPSVCEYQPQLFIDEIPSEGSSLWVGVFELYNGTPVLIVKIECSGRAVYNDQTINLLDLSERTRFLSNIQSIST